MTRPTIFKWIAGVVLAPLVLLVLLIALFDWNWLRGPIERKALEKTGRALAINGDLTVHWGWPVPHLRAGAVTFANPPWAKEKQMLSAEAVDIAVNLPQLFRRNLVLPEVRLERPVVFLEQASGGRKNWLLDVNQKDENARILIERLRLDQGKLGYDDAAAKTSVRAELSTPSQAPAGAAVPGLVFSVQGHYLGQPLKAHGSSGPVLGLRDETTPYPISIEGNIGQTGVRAQGTITSLLKFTAMDVQLALNGANLAQLYPLLGIAFPDTHAYTTHGHLIHAGKSWRYEKFSGKVGASDIAGDLRVETGGKRTALQATLVSQLLDLDDLGPMIGARTGSVVQAKAAAGGAAANAAAPPAGATVSAVTPTPAVAPVAAVANPRVRVLPDLPFDAARWNSVDAEVQLSAKTIRRASELPLENLVTHLSLRDSVLKLDPLDFGMAGGHLQSTISLDGNAHPIQAHAQIRARKMLLAKLFPTFKLGQNSIGQVNGEFNLDGRGNSVGQMLASSNGKVGLVIAGGEISKLMMEEVGLHIWEILEIKVTKDKLVKLRCGVAEFDVKGGIMRADALVFDTEVTTIFGTGNIDLGQEKLDLTLRQKTKNTSPLALRSPIHVRGSFVRPDVSVDKGPIVARTVGAVALAIVNPLLVLIPLIDAGPGKDSDCGQLVRDARAVPRPEKPKAALQK